jgi:hypothetical protein
VYLDRWTYEELEKGVYLILRKRSRTIALRHLFRASYRPENYCPCIDKVVGVNYYDVEQATAKLATLSLKTTPLIESQMVCTPHIWAALNKSERVHGIV